MAEGGSLIGQTKKPQEEIYLCRTTCPLSAIAKKDVNVMFHSLLIFSYFLLVLSALDITFPTSV